MSKSEWTPMLRNSTPFLKYLDSKVLFVIIGTFTFVITVCSKQSSIIVKANPFHKPLCTNRLLHGLHFDMGFINE